MSGPVVQRVAQLAPEGIAQIAATTLLHPREWDFLRQQSSRFAQLLSPMMSSVSRRLVRCGARLSETWIRFKLRRWRETASPAAAAKYVEMWGCSDISQKARGLQTPILIVAAAQDAPPFQAAALEASMFPTIPMRD